MKEVTMDASDIFKKLSAGVRFRRKTQVMPTPVHKPIIKEEPEDGKNESNLPNKKRKMNDGESFGKSPNDPVRLLDALVSENYDIEEGNYEKLLKKGKKRTAEEIEKENIAQVRNRNHISVLGKDAPSPVETFEDLKNKYSVPQQVISNLYSSGYKVPTSVQMQAIPLLLEGRQVLACAPTGSGKTAAFLVPIIKQLRGPKKGGFRACIVSPTRELAAQTFRECLRISDGTGLKAILISKISHVKEKFKAKAAGKYDILVTTPNRLVYLLKQEPPMVSLKKVEWLIVDECDKLFEAGVRGFRDQLAVIYNACDSLTIKRAMFSATQYPPLTKWCRRNLKGLVTMNVGVRNTACEDVDQELLFVGSESGKLVAFRNLIQQGLAPPVLVFVQSKERAQELFNELIYDGINVDVIHSDRTQAQRDNVIRCFREGQIWVLICTELMGRGIDFKGVNLVVNYDFPPSTVSYIHRVGRTGRAGRRGRAITYFTMDDATNIRSIARVAKESGCPVPDFLLHMKKVSKREKRQLEKRAPEREAISTTPIYETMREKRKINAIKRTKRKKRLDGDSSG